MENSKLPFTYWYLAFMMITGTRKSFSALEVQRQIGHKFYKPVWTMMDKIRRVMGKRDAQYQLAGQLEMDEGFFKSVQPLQKDSRGKILPRRKSHAGKGNPSQAFVLVMAESVSNPDNKNKHRSNRIVKHNKMVAIPDHKTDAIHAEMKTHVSSDSSVITDDAGQDDKLKSVIKEHEAVNLKRTGRKADQVLPWVHKAISNAKRNFLGIHHSIGQGYIQNYLNEFCFKLNRRYNHMDVFDRMIRCAASYQWI